ncbi:GT4 family glycosyltransferase PelF [Bacillus timonensis]|nr:GT4 family glycosyltransferase PelF [Bacillus timonensis]
MRICIISEGSYPYLTGGVSSWVQTIITNMPEHEFVIYAIGAHKEMKGKFKCTIPENVVGIEEVFLDSYLYDESNWGKVYGLTNSEKQAVKSLLNSANANWDQLFALFTSGKIDSVTNFLASKDFFDILQEICLENYLNFPFTDMFWTLRSMVLPLFICMDHELPKAELYHSVSTGYAGVLGSLAKYLTGNPFILTEHGIYTREREEEIIKANWVQGYFKDLWIDYFYNLSNCSYHYADKVISLFERNREVQLEIGCPVEKTEVIANGISAEDFPYFPKYKKKAGEPIHIGSIARIVPIKDIKSMLQAFAIVKKEVPNAIFSIMGPVDEDDEYYQECRHLVHSLNLEDVRFTGLVNMKEVIHQMDILVLSSISEGQPLAILEGFACGIPFVSTDVGGCRELLYGDGDEFGEAGIVVPIMHYVQLAHAIIKLCDQEELRIQMGLNGLNRVHKYYRKDMLISQYKEMYKKMGTKLWLG